MLTNEDKDWIAKEIKPVRDSVDLLHKKVSENNLDKIHSDMRLNAIEASGMRSEEKLDKLMTMLDGFTGNVADLDQRTRWVRARSAGTTFRFTNSRERPERRFQNKAVYCQLTKSHESAILQDGESAKIFPVTK